ncbi:PREDICTED: GC-rich sequence DNA-binding factor 2-like [Chrysochloris asiatica]|uniref:GC-rich sequence DNA-binding factor 2-like n=1 Tax=Chrysochloris asiatica TaxID=185453 RepID=A0A9B0TVJ6_CHRAS|nr:PREDICTED: GC-rich sequence DNA-binding factor 2-like [Chrysochloris asiatica]
MAHRPKRTFRQRRADSSDGDGKESSSEPGAPQEQSAPSPAEEGPSPTVVTRLIRGRRPRGRVWASSRRATRAAPSAGSDSSDHGDPGSESRTNVFSTDEEGGTHHSSESQDDQSSSSINTSSPEEKEFSSLVRIPDAVFIQAARRKRELARAREDYISLDVKQTSTTSGLKSCDEDSESEPDASEERIPFTPKPQTLRQRMAEEATTRSEESQDDENQDVWEEQQMRKAVKISEINIVTGYSPFTPEGI